MWDTWRGWVAGGSWDGDELLMFPFPSSTVESMTSIRLIPDQMLDVQYTRFFIGFVGGSSRSFAPIMEVAS